MLLVVLIVPGQATFSDCCFAECWSTFEHGWPWCYLERRTYVRITDGFLAAGSIPWLHPQCWSMRGREVEFDLWPLAADIACALALLIAVGCGYEKWRRRLWQFDVKQLAAWVAICGLAMTWWAGYQRRHRDVLHSADTLYKQHISLTFGYVGPTWLGRLTGGPQAFWEPDRLSIFGEDGCNVVNREFLAKNAICLSQIRDVNITTTSLPETTLESLAALPALEAIHLPMCPAMGDRECEELVHIRGLRELSLNGTKVSDAGIAKLSALRKLRKLDIRGTKITPAAVAQLLQALPRMQVVADWMPDKDGG